MNAIDSICGSSVDAILNSLQNSPYRWRMSKCGDLFSSSQGAIHIGNWNEPVSLIITIGDTVYSTPKGTIPPHVSQSISSIIRSYIDNRQKIRSQSIVSNLI